MTETPPDPTTEAEVSEEPAPEPQTEPDTPPAEPTPDEEPQDPPATEPGAEPQPQSPTGGNPDIPEPQIEQPIYTPGEEPEAEEVVIASISPEQGLAGNTDQKIAVRGENLDLVTTWTLDDEPAVVDVDTPEWARLLVKLSEFPTDTDKVLTLVGTTEDDQEVSIEFEVKPYRDPEGEPVTDQVFGQTVEVNPNPLRLQNEPPLTA